MGQLKNIRLRSPCEVFGFFQESYRKQRSWVTCTCWCSVGNDLLCVGNEPEGDSLEGNHQLDGAVPILIPPWKLPRYMGKSPNLARDHPISGPFEGKSGECPEGAQEVAPDGGREAGSGHHHRRADRGRIAGSGTPGRGEPVSTFGRGCNPRLKTTACQRPIGGVGFCCGGSR